jgi:vacuolar-type H+-ATPase subunit B/Vma2
MSTAPVVPHVSWLKHFGQIIGRVLGILAKDVPAIVAIATPVAEALLPQFSAQIQTANDLVSKIAKQAIVTEGLAAATGQATTGADKFQAVLANIGPEIDAWVANAFPGASQVSAVNKAGLVQAVVAIINEEVKPPAAAIPAVPPAA